MLKFQFHRLGLCEEASEVSPAPSGAGPAESAPAGEAEKPTQTPEVKAGIADKVRAILHGASGNAQTIAGLNLQIQQLTTERDTALQQIAGFQTELARLTTENTRLSTEARSVEDAIAGIGIPQANLPAQAPAGAAPADTIEELQAQLSTLTDPGQKGVIVSKLRVLRAAESAKKN